MADKTHSIGQSWEVVPLPCQSLDAQRRIVDVNDEWCALTGYSREEAIGMQSQRLVPEDHVDYYRETFALFVEQGYLAGRDCFLRTASGETRCVNIYGRMLPTGGDTLCHCILIDVTEHRESERALNESEKRFRSLFEDAPNPIVVHDGVSIVLANDAAVGFLGYERVDEVVGIGVADLVAPETLETVQERVSKLMAQDWTAPLVEEHFLRKDGTVAIGDTVASSTLMNGHRLVTVSAIDLAGRREAEAAMKESEERFRGLFEMSADAIVVHDGKRALFANRAAMEQFGVPSDQEVTGAPIGQFIASESAEVVARRIRELAEGSDAQPPTEVVLRRRDGSTWEAEATTAMVTVGGQRVMQTTFRDTTERKRVERELEQYRRELERLVEERTRSLDRVRAELGGVTAVIGRVVEQRDPFTAGHQRRVAALSVAVANELGMPTSEVDLIRVAADLHDIGKISVPAEILSKPGVFSALEYELVKCHVQASYEIISSAQFDSAIAEMVYQHHERLDGSGYPRGLSGEQVIPGARVLMVADVVEAMTSHRPYRPALGVEAALEEVAAGRGVRYDADVVDVALRVMRAGFDFEAAPF